MRLTIGNLFISFYLVISERMEGQVSFRHLSCNETRGNEPRHMRGAVSRQTSNIGSAEDWIQAMQLFAGSIHVICNLHRSRVASSLHCHSGMRRQAQVRNPYFELV